MKSTDTKNACGRVAGIPNETTVSLKDAICKLETGLGQKITGITVRDFFAGQALLGIIANDEIIDANFNSKEIAEAAYDMADVMLASRDASLAKGGK